jgi:methyltransferase
MYQGTALLIFVTLQRFAEVIWDRQNTARLMAAGAAEYGKSHYVFFAGTHATWLAGLWILGYARAVEPLWLVPFALLTIGRYWVMGTLGRRWTTRIVILAGAPLIKTGPYRFVRHPNYIVVIGEMTVVPLALGLPAYALVFFAIYACAAMIRIRAENEALLKVMPPRERRQYARPAAEADRV